MAKTVTKKPVRKAKAARPKQATRPKTAQRSKPKPEAESGKSAADAVIGLLESPIVAAVLAAGAAAAPGVAGAPTEFPGDAQSISAADLARKVSGKVFSVDLQNGMRWRLDYKANGYLFVNVSNGMATSGPWRAEDGRLCTHMRGGSASCNEVREQGQRLYLKRDNGDVIALNPQ